MLKFVSLSEVVHKSFCVKFSGLISKLKILEKSYESPRIFNLQTYIWSLFKAKRTYGASMKPSELFCFKDTKNFVALFFFLEACNKKFQQANANANKNAESLLLGDEFCCQRPRCRYTTFSFGIQNECCMSYCIYSKSKNCKERQAARLSLKLV